MEVNSDGDKTDGGLQVSSVQALIQQLHPSIPYITAQGGSNVVAPSIIGSTVGNININITSTGYECQLLSPDKHEPDTSDGSESPQTHTDAVVECQNKLRAALVGKSNFLLEGGTTEVKKVPLDKIYTELYITEGGSAEVNKEHEVRQMEVASRTRVTPEKSIHCNQLFTPQPGRTHHVRTVVTRGVAGIGKTVCTKKFTLDWAMERANTNVDFVFPLSFRELNLMGKRTLSLVELLYTFFPDTKDTGIFTNNVHNKMLFILDGLDESRLALDFHEGEIVSDLTEPAKIGVLFINLIRGRLLPSSLVWITSRPAASSQIPDELVDLVTEVRGFNNQQKDEYFRRKITDQGLANRVVAHVKSCRSLHIMCHIPVFCWMAASVLEKTLVTRDPKEIPKTLTKMYIHFLFSHVERSNRRLNGRRESNADFVRTSLMALGKLAFKELERGHLIFYEKDLAINGIGVTEASLFSGLYTQIFSEELTLGEQMFCFVHLSIQEFFAALYVFLTFNNDNVNVLVKRSSASRLFLFRDSSELILYKEAVEKALRCENGHFDIFLRFLLGLSLESNQNLLKRLMTRTNRTNKRTRTDIIKHIKERIKSSPSSERCLNLFHCLNELNDHSLVEEIQNFLTPGGLSEVKLSPAQWSTLVFVLLTSEEELSVFELTKYSRSEEGLLRMLPVIKTAKVVNLNGCNLTAGCCELLSSCISSSVVRELDLSNNSLTDTGTTVFIRGLNTSKLETLRLSSCDITDRSSDAVASLVSWELCPLKLLDLTDNDLQDQGVKVISAGLRKPGCKLETLCLSLCRVSETGCRFLASALDSCGLRELDLSYNHPGASGLELLSALRDDPHCGLQRLRVEDCGESRIQPGPKKYYRKLTLDPGTAHRDLSLSLGNTRAERWTAQPHHDDPQRFDFWRQVLCTEGLRRRSYWEVEWTSSVVIGVAYGGMARKGEGRDSWLGRNASSWGLICTKDAYRTVHEDTNAALTVPVSSQRVGVFLDWSAGTLSFYQVSSDSLTLLHTFHASFTEPVYPGFQLAWVGATVHLG